MRKYLVVLAAACCIFFAGGCLKHNVQLPKETEISLPPGQIDALMGPSHKRIELSSPRTGRKLLNIDVFEDERLIQLRQDQNMPIRIRPNP